MVADIRAVFTGMTMDEINNMHPQSVAAWYQQAHRVQRQRLKQTAHGVLFGNHPKGLDEIPDY